MWRRGGYSTSSASCTSGQTTRCAHGEPDAVEVARPVRRATARKPPAEKASPAPRRRPYLIRQAVGAGRRLGFIQPGSVGGAALGLPPDPKPPKRAPIPP